MAHQDGPQYGHCDSFFVETEGEITFPRVGDRLKSQAFAKHLQQAMAENISRKTCAEYQNDVLAHMEHMEVSSSQSFLSTIICADKHLG